jgi:N-methylhydantoinase A/oxoprolinase/acetone carboxylase beta subunit
MDSSGPRLRIGVGTGGTFTDVVAFDEVTGQVVVTTLVDAAIKPTVSRYVTSIGERLAQLTGVVEPTKQRPFSIMQSNDGWRG